MFAKNIYLIYALDFHTKYIFLYIKYTYFIYIKYIWQFYLCTLDEYRMTIVRVTDENGDERMENSVVHYWFVCFIRLGVTDGLLFKYFLLIKPVSVCKTRINPRTESKLSDLTCTVVA